MATTHETGHAKNLAHFQNFITYATKLGSAYNPTKDTLKIDALRTLMASATATLAATKSAKSAYEIATNEREICFKKLRPLASKVINALAVSDVYDQTVDDARRSYNKMTGKRSSATSSTKSSSTSSDTSSTGTTEPTPKRISVSQQSFDKQVDHLEQLIATLSAEPKYKPNERELSLSSLKDFLTELKACNLKVTNAAADFTTARIARDRVFDTPKTGLVDTALAVKTYVKSVFGSESREYVQFASLKFARGKA